MAILQTFPCFICNYKLDKELRTQISTQSSKKPLDKQGGLVAQYEYTLGAVGERTKVKELDRTVDSYVYRLTGEKITAADKTVTLMST